MLLQRFNQTLLAIFFIHIVKGFGYAIRVECQCVSVEEFPFPYRAVPLFKQSQHSRCGIEPVNGAIAPNQKSAKMTAIRVAQAAGIVVIFTKEQRGVRAISRILVEELVHRSQESLRLIQSDRALAAQVRLQVGHQESGGDAFADDVADHQAKPVRTKVNEIVIIPADLTSLNANTCVVEPGYGGQGLGKEPC